MFLNNLHAQNSFMTCFELHILIFFDTPVLMLYIAACIHCVLIDFSHYTHWRHSYCFSVDLIDFHTPDNGEVFIRYRAKEMQQKVLNVTSAVLVASLTSWNGPQVR